MIDDETFADIMKTNKYTHRKVDELKEVYKNMYENKPDRFTLEDDITHQEDVIDQIELLIEDILDNPGRMDLDDIVNTLTGVVSIHKMRTHKLWMHFKMIFELDEYRPQQCCNVVKNSYNPDMKVDPFDSFKE